MEGQGARSAFRRHALLKSQQPGKGSETPATGLTELISSPNLPPITEEAHDYDNNSDSEVPPEKTSKQETLVISKENQELMAKTITSTLGRQERQQIRNRYPVPEMDVTRVPKLDEIFTSSESKVQKHPEAKAVKKDLLHIQACSLEVVSPLLEINEVWTKVD